MSRVVYSMFGLHGGNGCLGSGFRANATIGHGIRLILMHLGGGIPGVSSTEPTQEGTMRKHTQFLTFFLFAAIAVGLTSCKTTTFPENPPPHEMLQAIEAWPDDYYWLIETGVSSRVLGLRQPGDSMDEALDRVAQMLEAVKGQWGTLSGLNSAQAIIDHLKANNLAELAAAIQQTLDANQAKEPGGSTQAFLQAYAIKQGLIGAYRKIKEHRG